MALSSSIIAIIARRYPQIWEIVGGGIGGGLRQRSAVEKAEVHMPPAMAYGAAVGAELVRAAGYAQVLNVAFEPGDDICPPRRWPPFPWPPAPHRGDDEGDIDYALGLAFALEASSAGWASLKGAGALESLHESAVRVASAGAQQG
ncbi:hypothetical protein [Microbacterium rhizosphaerae]|uniref:Uncharacterized protein n=1 Tax=Microbacterium rhizosphaerae TaxID=1678237 RepID=A0ABZ0SN61_9MICO|nr:hypothetical protein [Microbacterium rhizosphaerae]WPR89268.1 hypothetical protein SM116_16120 [Microbacterium rhizosphaerae]